MTQTRNRKLRSYPVGAHQTNSPNSSSVSNFSNSTNSKTVGSGVIRRPSENMLLNMAEDSTKSQQQSGSGISEGREDPAGQSGPLSFKPPNRKALLAKNERPISNDSINTEGDVFSINVNSSKDSSRGTSIIDDDEEHENGDKNSAGGPLNNTERDSSVHNIDDLDNVSHLTDTSVYSDADLSITTVKVASTPKSMSTKYFFNNGSQGKQMPDSFQSVSSSPKISRTKSAAFSAQTQQTSGAQSSQRSGGPPGHRYPISTGIHSKSVPTLHTESLQQRKPLTPSQRYRLRREQNKLHLQQSIKQKELFYDEEAKLTSNDLFDENLVWSIPMASHNTTFVGHRKNRASVPNLEKGEQFLDTHEMPPSPIPGVQRVSDLQYFQQMGKNLSAVYRKSEQEVTKSKILERTRSVELLPFDFKSASEEGMEDLKLVSDDKVSITSSTRPCWLPPKDTGERKSHEREVRKTLSMASIEKLETNHRREEQEIRDETNRQKLVLLIDRGLNRKSSFQDLRKVAWETGFSQSNRLLIYNVVLNTSYNIISSKFIDKTETLDEIIRTKMSPFPTTQMEEINSLLCDMPVELTSQMKAKLVHLMQWKSISRFGLQTGDNYLMYHFLLEGYDVEEVWCLANLFQLTCFNSNTRDKYDVRIMAKDGVVGKHLRKDPAFADEFSSRYLNYMTLWNCLARVDHDLFMWLMDIIVAENTKVSSWTDDWETQLRDMDWDTFKDKHVVVNYRILCSLTLTTLIRYHFGWNNLLHLAELPSSFQLVNAVDEYEPIRDQHFIFIKKWNHYYAKF